MLSAWRIVKERYAATAFDGEGARQFGGRWNSPGVSVVYVASTRALAALEMAIHVDRSTLLGAFVLIPCEFDESLVTELDRSILPIHWRRDPAPPELAAIGDDWIEQEHSAVLAVPSAIIEEEKNFLLSPGHSDFLKIKIGSPEPFQFRSTIDQIDVAAPARDDRNPAHALSVKEAHAQVADDHELRALRRPTWTNSRAADR